MPFTSGNWNSTAAPVLRMERICKSFSGVAALKDARIEAQSGEVHALMGENGAGKSTLMKILAGICSKDDGTIRLAGKEAEISSPREALDLGISMIHQELNPVRAMTVADNIFLGKEPCRAGWVIDRKKERELAEVLFSQLDISIDPGIGMKNLSVSEMQMVEIAKAVSYDSRIIIMDEPTSAITGREVEKLFEVIAGLKSRGVAVIYISHKMDEVFRIADSITVMRDGQYIETRKADQFDENTLVHLMVGRRLGELFPRVTAGKGEVSLAVDGLSRKGEFSDISFTARKGEVVGFSGLMGAGRTEVMETLFGMRLPDSGRIVLNGKSVRINSPAAAIRYGIALVTEDRQLKGLNLKASVRDNISLVSLKTFTRLGQVLRLESENRIVDSFIEKLRIRTHGRGQTVNTLSGGNQQKVVLAKWLINDPEIIILDEPTRGIDVGAKAEIYRIIANLAAAGKTILLVSSELPEILGLCDKVIVLYHGRVTDRLTREEFDQERIIRAAMGNINGRQNHLSN